MIYTFWTMYFILDSEAFRCIQINEHLLVRTVLTSDFFHITILPKTWFRKITYQPLFQNTRLVLKLWASVHLSQLIICSIYSFWSLEIHILELFFPESQGPWNYNTKMKADNIIQSRDFKKDAKHCAITELWEKMIWHLPFPYFFFSLLSFLRQLLLLRSSLFSPSSFSPTFIFSVPKLILLDYTTR